MMKMVGGLALVSDALGDLSTMLQLCGLPTNLAIMGKLLPKIPDINVVPL